MKYFAHIDDSYYRLCSITENYEARDPINNFIKWSACFEPKTGKIIATYEHTIHPAKIQKKTIFKMNARLIGDYKRKHLVGTGEDLFEIETLYDFGYDSLEEGLLTLHTHGNQNGFVGRKTYSSIGEDDMAVNFPDDPYRPYWMGAYFTTYDCGKTKHVFRHEDIDEILFYSGERGNVVTLLKFITPEWETLKLPPGDKITGWIHPSGRLDARYHIQVLR